MKGQKKIYYIDDREADNDDLEHYECSWCGTNIKDAEYGLREDAYGEYYCDSDQDCRNALVNNCNHYEVTDVQNRIVYYCDECGEEMEDEGDFASGNEQTTNCN
jgi:DNA-directed RNA polymerase subunit RPC12/RpoP